eukprot:COSAG01_NODE_64_length_29509_cov_1035.985209_29_plen_209_part_00
MPVFFVGVAVVPVPVVTKAVTGDAYWAVIEAGITVDALIVVNVIGGVRAVLTALSLSCVPSAAGAIEYFTTIEPASIDVTVMREASMLRTTAMSVAKAALNASLTVALEFRAATSPGMIIVTITGAGVGVDSITQEPEPEPEPVCTSADVAVAWAVSKRSLSVACILSLRRPPPCSLCWCGGLLRGAGAASRRRGRYAASRQQQQQAN